MACGFEKNYEMGIYRSEFWLVLLRPFVCSVRFPGPDSGPGGRPVSGIGRKSLEKMAFQCPVTIVISENNELYFDYFAQISLTSVQSSF